MKPITKINKKWFQFYYWDSSLDIFVYSKLLKRLRKAFFFELIFGHIFNMNDIIFVSELDLLALSHADNIQFYSCSNGKLIKAFSIKRTTT